MSLETSHKLKKVFLTAVLFIVGLSTLFVISIIGFSLSEKTNSNSFRQAGSTSSLGYRGTFIGEDSMGVPAIAPSPVSLEKVSSIDSSEGNIGSPIVERKLMQDGNLSLVVKRVEDAVGTLTGIAQNLGGRTDNVQYSNINGTDKKRAVITLRVPAVNFDEAMIEAKKIALKVEYENVSTRDVTEQFIDMQARLKNYKAAEEQYLAIMQKATKVSDILEVSQYLANVRQEIEQLQGQMNYLSRQVDMSAITISLSSEPDINATNVIWSPMTTANGAAQYFIQAFYRLIDALIWIILSVLPLTILFGGLIFLGAWFYMKVLRPTFASIKDFFHS